MATTARQEVALFLYYVEGWSHRRIGQGLGITTQAAHGLVDRGRRIVLSLVDDAHVDGLHRVRTLFEPSEAASPTRHIGRALTRQEELLDALALRLEQRESELAMYEQWLDGDSHLPSHTKKNPYDQWELHYLQGKKGEPLPTTAYRADIAAANCAASGNGCRFDCVGCDCRQGSEG